MSEIPANFSISQPAYSKPSALVNAHGWSDFLGLVASIGCAIHCAALPFILAFLPSLNLQWIADAQFHQWMFGACFLIAVIAFAPSLLRHRSPKPMVLGSLGLTLIGVAAFAPAGCGCGTCDRCAMVNNSAASSTRVASEHGRVARAWPVIDRASHESHRGLNPDQAEAAPQSLSLAPAVASHASAVDGGIELLLSWLTPLGGVLLVVAHLLNHHLGHFCRC